ncbi:MAG: transketolase [Methanoregula sp.]|uniref:transketolase n=1 Tax=Methanoregula sp. TaxID=2052170 RepID=UPI003C13425D
MNDNQDFSEIDDRVRKIRRQIITMIHKAGSGHPGGSLSCVEILTVLYSRILRHDPKNPDCEGRDRFILSKGHAAPALYAVLAEGGYIQDKELALLRKTGSLLQGHPDKKIPGVEVSTGSLGQGLSIASGIALSAKIDSRPFRTFVLMGDGECDEGQVWEAAMLASHYKLDNLVAVIDRNGLQIDGLTEKIMRLEPLSKKWTAFGWHVLEVDGHNVNEIHAAFKSAENAKGQPTVIIAHTFKGKGVSFMEWIGAFHGKSLTEQELELALKELA